MQRASNLSIKVKKSVFIPLSEPFSEALVHKVQAFLDDNAPNWSKFKVENAGEYLGFWIGPVIRDKIWLKAERKWRGRAQAIASAGVAPSLGIRMYNSRAVTTFGYVSQIHPLDQLARKK